MVPPKPSGSDSLSVSGFKGGWLEFSGWYPRLKLYTLIKVNKAAVKSFNRWETVGNLQLYHDTERKEVKVGIKAPPWSRKQYEIQFYPEKRSERHDDEDDEDDEDDDGDDDNRDKRTVDVELSKSLMFQDFTS